MKIQSKVVVPLALGVMLSGFGLWKYLRSQGMPQDRLPANDLPTIGKSCEIQKDSATVTDRLMAGILEPGVPYTILKNFYACHPVESGDVVYYRYSANFPPVPRIVRGIPGDRFKILKDASRNAWNIQVNSRTLMFNRKPYFFGIEAPPTLAVYEKTFNGVLPQNVFILFSNVPPGELDSANFGVMSLGDLVGKVDVRNQNPAQR